MYRDDKVHVSPDPDHGTVIDARHLRPLLIAHPPNLPLIGRILIEDKSSREEDARLWIDVFNPTCVYIYIWLNELDRLRGRINKGEKEGGRGKVSIEPLITSGDKVSRDGDRLTGCWLPSQLPKRG